MWIQKEIKLKSRARGFHLITDEILSQLTELSEVSVGILNIFIKHTSVVVNKNRTKS